MSKKILLVEDEALIAMAQVKILERHGYEVVTAYNGEKAMKAVDSDLTVSLILMDIDLGSGIDGTDAAREILKIHDIPIVFLTSHSEKEYVERVKKITRYGYVLKNSGEFVLIESINMAFELFEEKQRRQEHQREIENVNAELSKTNATLERKNEALTEAEDLLGNKISLVFDPKASLATAGLKEVLNIEHIQAILNNFHELTGMVTALLDLKGNILVATGWKDICTKFHRVHPETAKNCTESDLYLSDNLRKGEFVDYKCKNGLWDVVTPLYIGDTHFGNIYTGQYFYTQDKIDEEYFRRQADKYGFEEDTYLDALRQVPVYDKDTVRSLINFLIGFFELVASQSYTNIALAKESLEHKHSREKLQESEKMYKSLFNDSPVLSMLHNKDTGEVVDANEIVFKSYGYTSLSELNKKIFCDSPYSLKEAMEWIHKAANEGLQRFEWKNKKASGEVFWEWVTLRPLVVNSKERVLATAVDITKQKNVEKELQVSEERYRTIFHNSEVSLWEENFSDVRREINDLKQKGINDFNEYLDIHPEIVWDLASKIKVMDINEATLRLYGASSKKEMLGSLDKTLYLTDDTHNILKDELVAIAEGRLRVQGETKTKTLNGTVLNIMMNVYISNEKDIIIVAISDITPYKKALAAKDYLMKELNHRVKNNLAMVSSLISLKESEAENDLSDLKNRIEVIKLVHEKLHQQNDVEQIEVREYFQDLLESVFSSTFEQSVYIINKIEEIIISSKKAIPLGLVVNEIATNAIKYGFFSAQKSCFTIEMKRDSNNKQYALTLSNTGNPFPEVVELENSTTMGLQLVSNLVRQLDGTIELKKKPNPVFTIRFPIGEE